MLDTLSIKIKNYKCFGDESQGFDVIKPINLIIGRNNSGKSALIDLVGYCTTKELDKLPQFGPNGKLPQIFLEDILDVEDLKPVFSNTRSDGEIPGNHWQYAKRWIGSRMCWELLSSGEQKYVSIEPQGSGVFENLIKGETVASLKKPLIKTLSFQRLTAERDIISEKNGFPPDLLPNGSGATNLIQCFINRVNLPSSLVEKQLLDELNKIFAPDSIFTDIVVQQLGTGEWEIFLEEEGKGRVALSRSGSGLKTILLVLCFLILIPPLKEKKLSEYLFAFEELENNLHPALQRRLLLYIRKIAIEQKCTFFLTTHSNVVIDLFSNDSQAQIIHVTHNGSTAQARRVQTYIDNRGVLDDLDVRASDLLQANCIIWVEGPSDRLYFNRWIELWSDGELKEGYHYQCVFYGGRLLAHLSAEIEGDADWVQILRVNRNALVLIDSDKRSAKARINDTKKRIINEVEEIGGISWVTNGKEVENYIPFSVLKILYPSVKAITPLGQFDEIGDYLEKLKKGEKNRFIRNKVLFAERVCPLLTRESLSEILELTKKLDQVCNQLRWWNGRKE